MSVKSKAARRRERRDRHQAFYAAHGMTMTEAIERAKGEPAVRRKSTEVSSIFREEANVFARRNVL